MLSDIDIRLATLHERTSLEALQWRASLANPGDRAALLGHPDAIALPPEHITGGHVFVAERLGQVLGFAAILPRPDGDAELDALFVEPRVWNHGVGRLLIDHCAMVANQRGAQLLHVVGNPHAQGFYLACGFRATGTVTTRFGSGLAMQRDV